MQRPAHTRGTLTQTDTLGLHIHRSTQREIDKCTLAPRDKYTQPGTQSPFQLSCLSREANIHRQRWTHTQVYIGTGSPKDKPRHVQADRYRNVTDTHAKISDTEKMRQTQRHPKRQTDSSQEAGTWVRVGQRGEAGRSRSGQAQGFKAPSRILSSGPKPRGCSSGWGQWAHSGLWCPDRNPLLGS